MDWASQFVNYVTPLLVVVVWWMIRSWITDLRETVKDLYGQIDKVKDALGEVAKDVAFLKGKDAK